MWTLLFDASLKSTPSFPKDSLNFIGHWCYRDINIEASLNKEENMRAYSNSRLIEAIHYGNI